MHVFRFVHFFFQAHSWTRNFKISLKYDGSKASSSKSIYGCSQQVTKHQQKQIDSIIIFCLLNDRHLRNIYTFLAPFHSQLTTDKWNRLWLFSSCNVSVTQLDAFFIVFLLFLKYKSKRNNLLLRCFLSFFFSHFWLSLYVCVIVFLLLQFLSVFPFQSINKHAQALPFQLPFFQCFDVRDQIYAQNAKWTRAVRYYVCHLTQTGRQIDMFVFVYT